jgi:hypothetical protein
MEIWTDSKALRNTPTLHQWEEQYDNWVLRVLASLDRSVLENHVNQVLDNLRQELTRANPNNQSETDRIIADAERELRQIDNATGERGVPSVTNDAHRELADWQEIFKTYRDTVADMGRQTTQNAFDNTRTTGRNKIDDTIRSSPNRYPDNAPIRARAEDLKRRLNLLTFTPPAETPAQALTRVYNRLASNAQRHMYLVRLGNIIQQTTVNDRPVTNDDKAIAQRTRDRLITILRDGSRVTNVTEMEALEREILALLRRIGHQID